MMESSMLREPYVEHGAVKQLQQGYLRGSIEELNDGQASTNQAVDVTLILQDAFARCHDAADRLARHI